MNQKSIKAQRTFLPYRFLATLESIRGANRYSANLLKKSSMLACLK